MTFGDFETLCQRSPLPLCSLIKPLNSGKEVPFTGVLAKCYARTVIIDNTLIFEIGNAFLNIATLGLILVIIHLVRLRYTSVARKEMMFFFWSLFFSVLCCLIVDTGVSPPGSASYPYFVSLQLAMYATSSWALLYSGICGFGIWEDGSRKSIFSLSISSFAIFMINYVVAILTFRGAGSFIGPSKTTILFVFTFILNPLLILFWFCSQMVICLVMLVVNRWAIGSLLLTAMFFIASQFMLYGVSEQICEGLNHYADGLLFCTLGFLFCLMMLYKYWEIITFDDDEYYRNTQVVPGMGSEKETSEYC